MNQRRLTDDERKTLFLLVCYGRATPTTISRALGINPRTAQRLTDEANLAALIPPVEAVPLAAWYALLDRRLHSWKTPDGVFHVEARTASAVRRDLAFLVRETVGRELKARLVRECPPVFAALKSDLKRLLDIDFSIPDRIAGHFHYTPAPTFTDPDGNPV